MMAFPLTDTLFAEPYRESLKACDLFSQEYKTGKIIANDWAFTGHLHEDLGNNFGIIINKEELELTDVKVKYGPREWTHQSFPNGVYPVKVAGVATPCIGYFWASVVVDPECPNSNRSIQHGIVCYINDGDANAVARDIFVQQTSLSTNSFK